MLRRLFMDEGEFIKEHGERALHEFMLVITDGFLREKSKYNLGHDFLYNALNAKQRWLHNIITDAELDQYADMLETLWKDGNIASSNAYNAVSFAIRRCERPITNWHPLSASAWYCALACANNIFAHNGIDNESYTQLDAILEEIVAKYQNQASEFTMAVME